MKPRSESTRRKSDLKDAIAASFTTAVAWATITPHEQRFEDDLAGHRPDERHLAGRGGRGPGRDRRRGRGPAPPRPDPPLPREPAPTPAPGAGPAPPRQSDPTRHG